MEQCPFRLPPVVKVHGEAIWLSAAFEHSCGIRLWAGADIPGCYPGEDHDTCIPLQRLYEIQKKTGKPTDVGSFIFSYVEEIKESSS